MTIRYLLSALILAVLILFGYLNFIEVRKEILFLELSATIRSKTLQLRRHEKNFFLYGDLKELDAVHAYLKEITVHLQEPAGRGKDLRGLKAIVEGYGRTFVKIESIVRELQDEFDSNGTFRSSEMLPLIKSVSLDNPLMSAEVLRRSYSLPEGYILLKELTDLDGEINVLRKHGEDMISFSREFDKTARGNVDRAVSITQVVILFLLPMFLLLSFSISLIISRKIVNRLIILTRAMERASEGNFTHVPGSGGGDEVDVLIERFNSLERQLKEREREILESKKLVAIGTLASGVAHELNNPLSNIYTTAQRLKKKVGDEHPPFIAKGLDDIFDQTLRVKAIVSELLEFARGREPRPGRVEVNELIRNAYLHIADMEGSEKVRFSLKSPEDKITASLDPEQMEQVFVNLFRNAVEAMPDGGELDVGVELGNMLKSLVLRVSDTGKGMSRESIKKIFEPFYTTKDKGTGLGLAIVYNIVRKHGGDIRVRSEEGEGSTFTISLPLEKG